jgi:sec-independent protein translocase protein TatA
MTTPSLAIGMPSPQEMLPIILLLIVFFGAKRLPELARSMGRSITEFKRGREDAVLPESEQAKSTSENAES